MGEQWSRQGSGEALMERESEKCSTTTLIAKEELRRAQLKND